MPAYKEDSFDVVGIGVSPVDIITLVDQFPTGDEVHQAKEISIQGGGPVATALVTLSRLGSHTAMLDALGDDWRGNFVLDQFLREGVSTDYIQIRKGYSTALASILVHQATGERAIYHHPGNAPALRLDELPGNVIQNAKILHINGRHWEACQKAVEIAKQAGVSVTFDGGAGRYRPELKQLIPDVDILIVAAQFAQALTGLKSINECAQYLLKEGLRLVVITEGLQGSWIFEHGGESFHQPSFQMQSVVDTTGCGDSYHGAFLFGLLHSFSLSQTACFASAVAALNTQGLGGRVALPDYQSVITFIEKRLPGRFHFPKSAALK